MISLWERCQREDATLNEIVSAYEAAGDAGELVSAVQNDGDRAAALYVLAELHTDLTRPVWRCALPYAADPDDRTAFNALDIFHSFTAEAEAEDLLTVLESTDLAKPGLFTKLFAIMLSAPDELLRRTAEIGRSRSLPHDHIRGLSALAQGAASTQSEVRAMLNSRDLITRFYGCCMVGRFHAANQSLNGMLPETVKRRLALHWR